MSHPAARHATAYSDSTIPADHHRIFAALARERSDVIGTRPNPMCAAGVRLDQDVVLVPRDGPPDAFASPRC